MATQKQHLLKVFSGPHLGAEVLLGDGQFVIGRHEDCDVIFDDQLISDHHVRLTIAGQQVNCASVDGSKVIVDGQEIAESQLEPFQYFTIGNTHLAIGPANEPWPEISFPDYTLASFENSSQEDEASTTDEDAASGEEDKVTADSTTNENQSRPAFVIPLAVVAIVVLLIGSIFVLPSFFASETEEPVPIGIADLEKVVEDLAPDADVTISEKDGAFTASGVVVEREKKAELQTALREIDPYVMVRLWDTESLVRPTQTIIDKQELPLQAEVRGPGKIAVVGEVTDMKTWHEAEAKIKRDVRRAELIDEVTLAQAAPPTKPATTVQQTQQQTPITSSNPLRVGNSTGNGTSSATAAANETNTPTMTVAEVSPQAGTEANGSSTPEKIQVPNFGFTSFSDGRKKVLTIGTNQKVYEGGMLRGGYVVKNIYQDRVILVKDGKHIIYPLGDL